MFCIIGPNGAGKTTAIECLEGLRRQDSGSVLVAGLGPNRRPRLARPQDRSAAAGEKCLGLVNTLCGRQGRYRVTSGSLA